MESGCDCDEKKKDVDDEEEEEEPLPLNLETIPIEVLLQIFNFVDATDLLRNVSLVSKYFHSILSNEMTWKIKMEKRWGGTGDTKYPPIDLLQDDNEPPPPSKEEDQPDTTVTQSQTESSYTKIFTTCKFPWSKACVKREEQIKVWSTKALTPNEKLSHAVLNSHIGCIDSIHLFKQQNSMLLVSGARDRTISLWNVEQALNSNEDTSGAKIKVVNRAHDGWIWDFAVNSNNLFSCSWDTTAKIWDLNGMVVVGEYKSNTALLSISSNSTTIAIGGYNRKVLLIDPRNPTTPTTTFKTHGRSVLSVGLDDNYVISCGEDGLVAKHDLRATKLESSFKLPQENSLKTYPTCMSFRQTNVNVPYFYIGDNTGHIHLIDLLNFGIANTKKLHTAPVRGVFNNLGSVVSCSRDGKLVVSSSCLGLKCLRRVDVGDKIELPCVHSLDNVVSCGGGDGVVRIWGCTSSL